MLGISVVLCLACGTSGGHEPPAHLLRFEGGAARLDSRSRPPGLDAPWGGVRLGSTLDRGGVFALDIGLQGGTGPEPFLSGTLGAEIRLFPRSRVSGFVRGEIGLLERSSNPLYLLTGAGGGITVRLSPGAGVRAGVTWNSHGVWEEDHAGPVQAYGALEWRW